MVDGAIFSRSFANGGGGYIDFRGIDPDQFVLSKSFGKPVGRRPGFCSDRPMIADEGNALEEFRSAVPSMKLYYLVGTEDQKKRRSFLLGRIVLGLKGLHRVEHIGGWWPFKLDSQYGTGGT